MSATEGLHVPVIPFEEVVDKAGTFPPAQIVKLVPKLNVGVMFGFTVTENIAVVAHCPAVGVKAYVAEFWLSTVEGLHAPVIPFVDVVTKVGTDPPAQIVRLAPKLNVGAIF